MSRKRKSFDKQINCIIPVNLQGRLRELIDSISAKKVTDVQYTTYLRIIDLICKKQDLTRNDGYVALNSDILLDNLGSRYKVCINDLVKLNIIEYKKNSRGTASYSTDNHESINYRLTDTFRNEELTLVESFKRVFTNKPKKDIIDQYTKNLLTNTGFPEYSFLQGCLHKLKYDTEAAKAECERWFESGAHIKDTPFTAVRKELYTRAIDDLNDDEIAFTIKPTGKVYTNLTPAPKALTKFLKVEGYTGTLLLTDVSSTHILLALPAMREYKTTVANLQGIAELDRVEAMIASKKFYDTITAELVNEGVKVKDKKGDFIRLVCNSDLNHTNSYKTAFEKLYPTFSEFIRVIRKGKAFTSIMNPFEARLFNNRIANRVVTELGSQTFLAIKFDALIYKEEDREAIEKIVDEEVFKMSGLKGMYKTCTLKEETDKAVSYPSKQITEEKEAKAVPVLTTEIKQPVEFNNELISLLTVEELSELFSSMY